MIYTIMYLYNKANHVKEEIENKEEIEDINKTTFASYYDSLISHGFNHNNHYVTKDQHEFIENENESDIQRNRNKKGRYIQGVKILNDVNYRYDPKTNSYASRLSIFFKGNTIKFLLFGAMIFIYSNSNQVQQKIMQNIYYDDNIQKYDHNGIISFNNIQRNILSGEWSSDSMEKTTAREVEVKAKELATQAEEKTLEVGEYVTNVEAALQSGQTEFAEYTVKSADQTDMTVFFQKAEDSEDRVGEFKTDDHEMYKGQMKAGQYNGFGELFVYNDHLVYRGEWMNNQYGGLGTYYVAELNAVVQGNFFNNGQSVIGRVTFSNTGMVIEGQINNLGGESGDWQGQGMIAYKVADNDYSVYEGGWKKEGNRIMREGQGRMIEDGTIYEGGYKDDVQNGHGKLIYKNNDVYEGEFENNQPSGHGILKYKKSDKSEYDGEFQKGLLNGQGTLTYTNGNVYKGGFKDGVADGDGTMAFNDGSPEQKGKWIEGIFQQ